MIDGDIARPTVDLLFDRPNEALGLRAVKAHLDPIPAGFAFTAAGQSRLGPFSGEGQILLPRRRAGADRRRAARRRAGRGRRARWISSPAEFQGRLTVAGGGYSGALDLAPQGSVQRIVGRIEVRGARLGPDTILRQGRTDFTIVLDPMATRIEASASGSGLRRGSFSLAQFAGSARLAGETGEVRGTIAGQRAGGFQIQSIVQIAPTGYTVAAESNSAVARSGWRRPRGSRATATAGRSR
ncbi:hypothetical protein AB5I41_11735 [Sphingomonas sp. MMS24-JH45]